MKRLNNIFDKIIDIDNLLLASDKAVKNDSKKSEIKYFYNNKDELILKLHYELKNNNFTTSKYRIYNINDRGKEREIYDLPFYPDRIVHWAIMLQIEDMFLNNFIYDTYAAIPNKGGHLALKRIKKAINKNNYKYCLKLDVKKYFPNIDQDILKSMIRRKIKCKSTLKLLDDIINSIDNGIPIGNYTSQYFGNFYLSYFDHYCKEKLKIKNYYRYMDDIVVLCNSKDRLHMLFDKMKTEINKLKLKFKNNYNILNIKKEGIDFVGYRIFKGYVLLRKSILKKLKSKLSGILKHFKRFKNITYNMRCTIESYKGWIIYCNSYNIFKKYFNPILLIIKEV